jgi:signal transduction histidine kinase
MPSRSAKPKLVEALARVPELLDRALGAEGTQGRAARLAEALRALWPAASLCACRLESSTTAALVVLDQTGRPREKWAAALEARLASPAVARDGAAGAEKLPASLRLSGHALHVSPITGRGQRYGVLAIATPSEASPADGAAVRALLDDCAERLALRLQLEETSGRIGADEKELQELSGAADVAEAFGVFLHELGNLLNNLVLDVRLLERELPPGAPPRLAEIGRLAGSVPSLLGHLARFRQARRQVPRAVDLNRVAARVVDRFARSGAGVQAELAPDLPAVSGTPVALGRLVRMLTENALAVTPPSAGPVRLRTERVGDQVRLSIADNGPPVPAEALPRLFEPFVATREGQSGLELAICKAQVRRLLGSLEAVSRPEGGVTFITELPIYSEEGSLPG